LKYINPNNLDQDLVDFLVSVGGSYTGPDVTQKNKISITTLIDPPLIRQLKMKHWDELEQDVRNLQHAALGTMIHYVFEKYYEPKKYVLLEERMELDIGGMTLSGQFDRIEFGKEEEIDIFCLEGKEGTLVDIKSVGVFGMNEEKMHKWFTQVNIYRYLVWKIKKIDIKNAYVFVVNRDWRNSETKKKNKSGKIMHSSYPTCMFDRLEVPLVSYDRAEKKIKELVATHLQANKDQENTVVCSPKERWSDEFKYAVMKEGDKISTKNYLDKKEAQDHVNLLIKEGINARVEDRPPSRENVRCINNWCGVSSVCSYYQKWKESK